jgi:CHAT domain-containing protein/tetratricopeptide (TPR) repeat protein
MGRFAVRRGRPAFLLLAILSLAAPAALGGVPEDGEVLASGPARERPITGTEKHVYHVTVGKEPLAVLVEQRNIDLVVVDTGPGSAVAVDTGDHVWGTETLVLESPGEHRVEIHPKERFVVPGHYAVRVEVLPASTAGRGAALSLMSRAGHEAFAGDLESRHRAVALYREAVAAWHSLGERRWEAEALYVIAVLERNSSEMASAVEDFLKAWALWRQLNEPQLEAATLNGLGMARSETGEITAARENLQRALSLWQGLDNPFEEAEVRGNLCYLDLASGILPAARSCFEENLARYRELGYKRGEARTLNNLGGVHDGLGEPDAALERYRQSLALWQELGDPREEARNLNNIAVAHRIQGEWQEALRFFGQEREILDKLDDRNLKGVQLSNLGFAYNGLGEPERATPLLDEAVEMLKDLGTRRNEIIALNNLGTSWRNRGEPDKALIFHRRALELAETPGDPRQQAISRLRISEAELDRGDAAASLRELPGALEYFHATSNARFELEGIGVRGRALLLGGRRKEALPVLQSALALHRELRDRAGEAETLQTLAAAERSLGRFADARAHAEEAVAQVEKLRTGFVSPSLRAAFLATQHRAYGLVIDLLMDRHKAEPGAGHDREAFEENERVRARSLLDVLFSASNGRPGSAVPGPLLERRQALRRRLSAQIDQQLKQSGARAKELEKEVEDLLVQLDAVEAEIRRLDPHYAAVATPAILTVAEIAKLLDPGTLLLEYSLGEDRSYLWAVGKDSFHSFVLPSQREIEAAAHQVYTELSIVEAGADRRGQARETLSRMLLGPVWPEAEHYQRLVVVPDASLHLVPFGVLPAPGSGEYLLDRFEIVSLPSATTLALQRQRLEHRVPAAKWAAVLADPVFTADDQRLVKPAAVAKAATRKPAEKPEPTRGARADAPLSALERLPATGSEADSIASLAPGPVWIGRDLEANREAVLAGNLRSARVVHFATHAIADTHRPELSGLVLSLFDAAGRPREGFLSLSDIYELDLDADLAVLSGCATSLGKEVQGEGVMGLSRGFFYAGAPRVVASLWPVQDRTTAELMDRFYRSLWKDHLPAAAALRAAQQSLRHSNRRYSDPHSWAGFVLQGDWR